MLERVNCNEYWLNLVICHGTTSNANYSIACNRFLGAAQLVFDHHPLAIHFSVLFLQLDKLSKLNVFSFHNLRFCISHSTSHWYLEASNIWFGYFITLLLAKCKCLQFAKSNWSINTWTDFDGASNARMWACNHES